ncbi:response regulator transcription factor [uncultured Shewanella sp.]|uniref:response regulator transcription factor n=1 Tax=uncultured Shewanella sp. TaxID=173975 RepID=UPI00260B0904|nr:response regulator transcription factor [uncultured Shewanella sp.]
MQIMNGMPPYIAEKMKKHILLIEQDKVIANQIILNLQTLNVRISHCTHLACANLQLAQDNIDLIIMERQLPDGDGIWLCQKINIDANPTPCMLLTTYSSEADIVLGLDSGADDYITKPFRALELRARVNALLRRSINEGHSFDLLEYNGIQINKQTREVMVLEQVLTLTAREFDLLVYLATYPKQVFSRVQLLEAVWGYSYSGYEHTVNTHINRLRSKLLKQPGCSDLVETVWGVGYKFSPPVNLPFNQQ